MYIDSRRDDMCRAYKARLEEFLDLPKDASDQDIHKRIEIGFLVGLVRSFCDVAKLSPKERCEIIALTMIEPRLDDGQRLTADHSERLYRFAHILAKAEVIFGDEEKSRRWLSKPKFRLAGKSPISMLGTYSEARQVEEMLVQMAESLTL